MRDSYTRAAIPWGDRKAAKSTAQPDSSAPPPGGTARHRFALPQRMPILTIQLYRLKAEYWVGAQSWVGARDQCLWVPRPWVLQRPGFSEILTAVEFSF